MPTSSAPPPLDIALPYYFAVQIQPREAAVLAVEAVCTTAKMMGILFRRVEVVGLINLGGRNFVRMRSDLARASEVLTQLNSATNRGVMFPDGSSGMKVLLSNGRSGTVEGWKLHVMSSGASTMYRGPKIKNWERQFQN